MICKVGMLLCTSATRQSMVSVVSVTHSVKCISFWRVQKSGKIPPPRRPKQIRFPKCCDRKTLSYGEYGKKSPVYCVSMCCVVYVNICCFREHNNSLRGIQMNTDIQLQDNVSVTLPHRQHCCKKRHNSLRRTKLEWPTYNMYLYIYILSI
jgi:hypothetical protein